MFYKVEVSIKEIYSSLELEFDRNALPLRAPVQGFIDIVEKTGCLYVLIGGSVYRGVAFKAINSFDFPYSITILDLPLGNSSTV